MKSIILSIISLLICVNCYAAPGFLDDFSNGYVPIIYLGEAKLQNSDDTASIYTTSQSVDIMLNTFQYNHKDWTLYILIELRGLSRKDTLDQALKNNTQWFNTKSGSRIFWALGKKMVSKNNILGDYSEDDYYNDEGELMGVLKVQNMDWDLSTYTENVGMKAINSLVVNYLDKEYQRRYGRDNGRPIQ